MRYKWVNTVNEIGEFAAIRHNRDRRKYASADNKVPNLDSLLKDVPNKYKRANLRKSVRAIKEEVKKFPTYSLSAILDQVTEKTGINRRVVREALSLMIYSREISITQEYSLILSRSTSAT